MVSSSTIYTPMIAPNNVAIIKDQFPIKNCKTAFKIAVAITKIANSLLSLTAGINRATNKAYNEILKLFATITGSMLSIKTPMIAPKIQDIHAIPARPI